MSTPIKGDLCLLKLRDFGNTDPYTLIGCTTGDSITFNTEMLETTGTTGGFIEMRPTYKSGTISSDTVLLYSPSGPELGSIVLIGWEKVNQKLDFEFSWTEDVNPRKITGAAYITSLSINAPAQDFASVQLTLNITGEWQLDF